MTKLRRIAIDDCEPVGRKPTKRDIRLIGQKYPTCDIMGFGFFGFSNYHYVLIWDDAFSESEYVENISFKTLKSGVK